MTALIETDASKRKYQWETKEQPSKYRTTQIQYQKPVWQYEAAPVIYNSIGISHGTAQLGYQNRTGNIEEHRNVAQHRYQ